MSRLRRQSSKRRFRRLGKNGIRLYNSPARVFENGGTVVSKSGDYIVFYWDLHLLTVQGRKAVLVMNCNSRYSILLYDMMETDWLCLPDLIESEIKVAILREGLSKFEAARCFALGGPLKISPPHGSNPAERLNCAMAALIQQFSLLDESRLSQPRVCHVLNGGTYDVEGFSGTPREVFLAGFRFL